MIPSLHTKIRDIGELAHVAESLREQGKTIVHCHGVFDLLHIGHIRYFCQARGMGDVLLVTLTPDRFVDKGPHRPAFPEVLRAEAIASLSCVDYVAINEWPTAEETLRLLKPHFYVKGVEFKTAASDMTGKMGQEEAVARETGTTVRFTEDIVFSSSSLINRFFSNFSEELRDYLALLRTRYDYHDILRVIDGMASLKVLVVGDAIVDEYQYCEAIGKSSKDPILAVKYNSSEQFAGGAAAIANHMAHFAAHVDLVSVLGKTHTYEDVLRERMHPAVSCRFIVKPGGHTVVKRRFLDGYSLNKLLEVYVMDELDLPEEQDRAECAWLMKHLPEYDVVLAADFGHRGISSSMLRIMTQSAPFLAVMTQANAGNRGFNTASKYPRADYLCISEHELRLESRDSNGPLKPMMHALAQKMGCTKLAVTRGRKGCFIWDRDDRIADAPSLAANVLDRVGAGDAFLAVTSMAARQGVPADIMCFIGNVAGGLIAQTIGNMKYVDPMEMKKWIVSMMK